MLKIYSESLKAYYKFCYTTRSSTAWLPTVTLTSTRCMGRSSFPYNKSKSCLNTYSVYIIKKEHLSSVPSLILNFIDWFSFFKKKCQHLHDLTSTNIQRKVLTCNNNKQFGYSCTQKLLTCTHHLIYMTSVCWWG